MPLVVAGQLRRLELGAFSVLDLVNAKVVFQRVVARDVVVLRILGPPDQTAATVDLTGDGLELDAQVDVLVARPLRQRDVERRVFVLGFLVEDVVIAVQGDLPLADLAGETLGDLAGLVRFKAPGSLGSLASPSQSRKPPRRRSRATVVGSGKCSSAPC